MKKAHSFFIVPFLLLGPMYSLAQKEAKIQSQEMHAKTDKSLEEARAAFLTAKENLAKAATGSRSSFIEAQNDYNSKKENYRISLESAISNEKDQALIETLKDELNLLNK